jgi:DNA polymerase I
VEPGKVVEVMGLMGDGVDNIPGVKGIGEKTAIALIEQFETLENLYNRLDEVDTLTLRAPSRLRKILEDGKDAAFVSRMLATLKHDAPLAVRLEDLKLTGFNREMLRGLFAELDFRNLLVLLDNGRL